MAGRGPRAALSLSVEDTFCEECDVTMDLHDEPGMCESAQMKANVLAAWDRMLWGVIGGAR